MARNKMLMTTTECLERFGSFYRIAKAVREGLLCKVDQGIYSDGKRYDETELLLLKYPAAALTMQSAYYYYNLSDNVPDKIHLSVERNGTKINDERVVEYFVPRGTGSIGVVSMDVNGTSLRIFDRERLLIETVRMRTKMPLDLYREVINNYRKIAHDLYPAKMEDYLAAFPKREVIFDTIMKEVL